MGIRSGILLSAFALAAVMGTQVSQAQIGIGVSINVAPPELPVYELPPVPGDGYLWTPGYWAWADDGSGYYWVPGTWVLAPQPGYLWTPGYWGWENNVYLWHGGYWGPHVGFYGGVNYGFGYGGVGYGGAEWRGGALFYNTNVVHPGPSVHITNVYNQTVVNNVTVNRVSFNGGSGGIQARPTAAQEQAAHEQHLAPIAAQRQQETVARSNPALRASVNGGHPAIAATSRPGEFSGKGVVAARNAETHAATPENRASENRAPENRVQNNAPHTASAERPAPGPEHSAPAPRAATEHTAPAPRVATEHAAPAPHVAAPRPTPAPAERAAPAPRENVARAPEQARPAPHPQAAPRPQQEEHPAPAPHAEEHRPER